MNITKLRYFNSEDINIITQVILQTKRVDLQAKHSDSRQVTEINRGARQNIFSPTLKMKERELQWALTHECPD